MVLVAPSWGVQGILESVGRQLIDILLRNNYRVTVRPHPQTRRLRPDIMNNLENLYDNNDRVKFEAGIGNFDSLLDSCVLISDWSGVAMEYAFSLSKPVVFIDVPRKVRNDDYERQRNIPIEVFIREEIGCVVAPDNIDKIPSLLEIMISNNSEYISKISALRRRWLFNPDNLSDEGISYLNNLT
jgi:YidC/Oxa1 family membrane protein insertase